jgi:hypothetical protein
MRFTVEIYRDEHGESPREWDNIGTFWTWHPRYGSPDKGCPNPAPRALRPNEIGLPVWLYEHSGLCYRAALRNPFTCPWDSGQVGVIFTTPEVAQRWFGWKSRIITRKRQEMIFDALKREVEMFDAWQSGNTYGWNVIDEDGDVVEGCGGYICRPAVRGDWEHLHNEAMASLKSCLEEAA